MSTAAFPSILSRLLERRELSSEQVATIFDQVLTGSLGDAEASAFLIAMRMKGETAGELAAAANALRRVMVRFDTDRDDLLDTCGTGGDDASTFNISTAAAIVAAGAGVPVVKHGNRAVSSRCGSADVLAELGVRIDAGPTWARRCLNEAGLAFCFAPHFHPAMKHLADVRRRLGVRTMVNLLGPLANPAGAAHQLLGVGRRELLDPVAGALAELGTRGAFVVFSDDGLDEVSLGAATHFRFVRNRHVERGTWNADDFGLAPCSLSELRANGPEESAKIIRDVLSGAPSAARRVTLANAAIAIFAAGRASTIRDAVRAAEIAIDSGRAADVLRRLTAVDLSA